MMSRSLLLTTSAICRYLSWNPDNSALFTISWNLLNNTASLLSSLGICLSLTVFNPLCLSLLESKSSFLSSWNSILSLSHCIGVHISCLVSLGNRSCVFKAKFISFDEILSKDFSICMTVLHCFGMMNWKFFSFSLMSLKSHLVLMGKIQGLLLSFCMSSHLRICVFTSTLLSTHWGLFCSHSLRLCISSCFGNGIIIIHTTLCTCRLAWSWHTRPHSSSHLSRRETWSYLTTTSLHLLWARPLSNWYVSRSGLSLWSWLNLLWLIWCDRLFLLFLSSLSLSLRLSLRIESYLLVSISFKCEIRYLKFWFLSGLWSCLFHCFNFFHLWWCEFNLMLINEGVNCI